MQEIIRVEHLTKEYGSVKAVDDISFGIKQGICFGLLGPNGAGKTTTIEMMEGIHSPSGGSIFFKDHPISKKYSQYLGIQFQHTALPEYITVKETIQLFSAFYPNPRPLAEVVDLCSLDDILNRDNQKLSGGQKQRMLLALAILPRPELVFLDEPTTGLDPQARRNFWDLIAKIKAEKTTIILTTHYMDEAEVLCDEIAIMDHGKIIAQNTPSNLLKEHFEGVLLSLPKNGRPLPNHPDLAGVYEKNDNFECETTDLDKSIRALFDLKLDLTGLGIHKPDLEDLFIKLTGSSLRV